MCKKRLIGKLVLECEDEMSNTNETLLDDKKETCEKNIFIIQTVSLVIVCLLLVIIISISCYYYYTRNWIKNACTITLI